MNDVKLQYPIEFHKKKSLIVIVLIASIALFVMGSSFAVYYKELASPRFTPMSNLFVGIISLLMGLYGIYTSAKTLINNKPSIILDRTGIELHQLFDKTRCFDWSEVKNIELREYIKESVECWNIAIIPHQLLVNETVFALKNLTYQGTEINEQEIFAIIEQSFKKSRK